jgi:hypothetical protein
MAGLADNFSYSTYVSGDGNSYSMRSITAWATAAVSGGTATSAFPLYGKSTRRRKPRLARFRVAAEPGRILNLPVFTPTAFAALVIGTTTFARGIRGEAAAVTFTLSKTIGEQIPSHVMGFQAGQFP